jgi:ABC-2 type transport system permease protein
MRRSTFALSATFAALVAFAGLNLAAWKWLAPVRIDFTQNHLYTLSDSAKTVVNRLVEPVELELVYSRTVGAQYPEIRAHAARVLELMNEIAARSGGKVRLRETDPEPFSDEEDRVAAAGLQPTPTDGGDPLYFGVLGRNSVDDVIAIPFLSPERDGMLEYELVRLISQLDDPAPPKVAVISSLPALQGDGTGADDAFVLREMRRAFEVTPLDASFRSLPADADMLMIVHPSPLNDWQLYLIDQFLLQKGRALIALDPVSRVALATGGPRAAMASNLGPVLATLGVSLDDQTVADRSLALPVEVDAGAGRRTVEGQPLFISVPRALMANDDPVTADLSRAINFGAAGRLIKTNPSGVTVTPLVETTDAAGLIPAAQAALDPAPRVVVEEMQPGDGAQMLAARISGELATAYPAGPPKASLPADPVAAEQARIEMAKTPAPVPKSIEQAEIIVTADADFFDDGFYINPNGGPPLADNAAFILNALDNLAGDPALMSLRSRAPAARPMARVDKLRASARDRLYAEQERLETLLAAAEKKLKAFEDARPQTTGLVRSESEAAELATFRADASRIRQQLRGVERDFRRDIDRLSARLELINIWLPPLFAGLAGVAVFLWRSRKRRPMS